MFLLYAPTRYKADNIFLSGDSIRIGDFGGAVVLKKGQMMTALEGSPINCAPEMIKGEGYSFPRDWWSVGIIIYQMIGASLITVVPCLKLLVFLYMKFIISSTLLVYTYLFFY